MTRRKFTTTAAGLSAAAAGAAQPGASSARAIFEIRRFQLRNTTDNQVQRTTTFLEKTYAPALQRAGAKPAGFFGSVIAPEAPFLMSLTSYPSMAAVQTAVEKLEADAEYQKNLEAAYAQGLLYSRMETWLLRAFETTPQVEIPPAGDAGSRRAPRVFEMRMYESNDMSTLKRKIGMFNSGEIAIFRKVGMATVFFGEMIAGPNMPNLVYMVGFDSLAAREKLWGAFGSDPDWVKMRATPGLSDGEVVSNITNSILRPLSFSPIR